MGEEVSGEVGEQGAQDLRVQEEHGGQEKAHGQKEHLGDPEPG